MTYNQYINGDTCKTNSLDNKRQELETLVFYGAGDEARTRDILLGKLSLKGKKADFTTVLTT